MARFSSFFLQRAFAVSFSFSFTFSCYSYSYLPSIPKFPFNLSIKPRCSSYSSSSPSQKLAADLLSLLGSAHEAARIPKDEASQLKSCLLFLVPPTSHPSNGILEVSEELRGRELSKEDERVWWPPASVMELARIAVDSGGDPGSIQRALDPTMLSVPDCEGLQKDKCQLTRTTYAHRFVDKGLNSYFEFLFEFIVERASSMGVNLLLSRYDLFHGHLFLARNSGRLGILIQCDI
ncbi:hypothetical protein HPP92_011552 [Vanilla planifolia]|uniref:Uncharacterized protein n=1 Tax=Vanilla planifolia TaxID=51239 RepID=A0A835RBP8_VANPL|nr:hypothetical protein HPP92_011552 [Vanilla planifolia]